MSRAKQAWIWIAALAAAALLLYAINDILLPFVVGVAIAYFLDPVADELERLGCSRVVATSIITVAFFATVVALIVLLYPLLQSQVAGFVQRIPALVEAVRQWVEPLRAELRELFPGQQFANFSDASQSVGTALAAWLARVARGIWQGGLALFNLISLIVITPVVAFYLLRDWDRMVAKVDSWLPREFAPIVRRLLAEIDRTISGFVRGQALVVLFLATVYGGGLTLVGLDFGLLVGVSAGLISFVPYVGTFVGLVTATTIAVVQFGDVFHILMVLGVFGFGQVIESAILTPKLVGDRVGLHAVWIIFALLVGGLALGFTGVLLAVPVAATIGVLVRFFLGQYLASSLYSGTAKAANDGDRN